MPMIDNPRWEIIHGDSLTVLESFPPSTFDAAITDAVANDFVSFAQQHASNRKACTGFIETL